MAASGRPSTLAEFAAAHDIDTREYAVEAPFLRRYVRARPWEDCSALRARLAERFGARAVAWLPHTFALAQDARIVDSEDHAAGRICGIDASSAAGALA